MNSERTPWFLNPTAMKITNALLWIPHIFSMIAIYRFLPIWVPIVCVVLYVFLEKYIGYFIDVFAFIVSIIHSGGWLIAVLAVCIIYPWILNICVRRSIVKLTKEYAEESEE